MSTDTAEAHAIALAYRLGFAAGEHALAVRAEAVLANWRAAPRFTWEQQVAASVAEMEALAKETRVPTYDECMASWGCREGALAVTA